jgi:hypothetical protein
MELVMGRIWCWLGEHAWERHGSPWQMFSPFMPNVLIARQRYDCRRCPRWCVTDSALGVEWQVGEGET